MSIDEKLNGAPSEWINVKSDNLGIDELHEVLKKAVERYKEAKLGDVELCSLKDSLFV